MDECTFCEDIVYLIYKDLGFSFSNKKGTLLQILFILKLHLFTNYKRFDICEKI